jgi:hypothetical protein
MSTALAVRYGKQAERGIGAGGEKTTETLLWENSNTSTARSSLDATLSQSLQNFQKIRVEYSYNTGSSNADYYVVFPVKDANGDYMFPSGNGKQRMNVGLNSASGNGYVRYFYVTSDTVIHFGSAYRINASGNNNANLIPWKIYGINGGYGGSSGGGSSVPVYTGTYEVTPKANTEQTLQTAGKQLLENVTVHEVPYYETSNTSGTTVYIANEV